MNLLEADTKLRKLKQSFLTTREVAAYLDMDIITASTLLSKLMRYEKVVRLGRGRWLISEVIDPFAVPEYLTTPFPTYISLQSALYHYGMISQIPAIVYAVSLSRTKRYKNPIGDFSIHHIDPKFFFGFESMITSSVKIATPEKALIDFLYLFPARSRLFRALPELTLSKKFNRKTALTIIDKIPSRRKQSLVQKLFREILVQFPI